MPSSSDSSEAGVAAKTEEAQEAAPSEVGEKKKKKKHKKQKKESSSEVRKNVLGTPQIRTLPVKATLKDSVPSCVASTLCLL